MRGVFYSVEASVLYVFRHTFAILSYMKSLQLSKPHIIAMMGIPGSGKTFFAEQFAETFNASLVSYEKINQNIFGNTINTKAGLLAVDRVASYMLKELLKSGHTIILDGPTESRANRIALAQLAKQAGYETLFVWSQIETATAKSRATKTNKDKTGISIEMFEGITKRFTVPSAAEKAVVISGKHTFASQLRIVLKHLVEPRTEAAADLQVPRPRSTTDHRIMIR